MNALRCSLQLLLSVLAVNGFLAATGTQAITTNSKTFLPIIVGKPAVQPAPTLTPKPTPTLTPTPTATGLSADEQEVLRLANDLRSSVGCAPLVVDTMLEQAAVVHSTDMADHDTMSHTGTDGSQPWDRAGRFGYTGMIGENIAAGYPTAAAVFQAWRESSGHYKNLVNCAYQNTGISVKKSKNGTYYWTQIFGKRQ